MEKRKNTTPKIEKEKTWAILFIFFVLFNSFTRENAEKDDRDAKENVHIST